MCDCVKQTAKKLKELFLGTEKVDFVNQELISGKLFSPVEIKIADKKKPTKTLILYSYCPICGSKYDEGD